ncbi:MAG: multicopper oxidase domain-containing protein [Patescibacteria group bacterium]
MNDLIWRFRFNILLTIFLVTTFVYYLPMRFLYLNLVTPHHGATATSNNSMGSMMMPTASDIAKLPLKTRTGEISDAPFIISPDGVKEFRLTAQEFRWEYQPGKFIHAWGYNGMVPGPTIRATEGEKVRVIVKNELNVDTSVHWHGVDVPWQQDGVPYLTQAPIKPGQEFTYEFNALPSGTRFYHSHGADHTTAAQQMDMGLSGAFIIAPKDKEDFPAFDKEYTLVLDEWNVLAGGINSAIGHVHGAGTMGAVPDYNLFTINGHAFPATEPVMVKKGEKILIRFINAGTAAYHPMHMHGHNFTVVAKDGNLIPKVARETRNTITIQPGETVDILVDANNPGPWMLHCHHVHHATAGMTTLFQYEGYEPLMPEPPMPDMSAMMMPAGQMDMTESMPHTH